MKMAYFCSRVTTLNTIKADADSKGMKRTQAPQILSLLIYREYQRGATVEELAAAFDAPVHWIEERIEAVRLCFEKQVRVQIVRERVRR